MVDNRSCGGWPNAGQLIEFRHGCTIEIHEERTAWWDPGGITGGIARGAAAGIAGRANARGRHGDDNVLAFSGHQELFAVRQRSSKIHSSYVGIIGGATCGTNCIVTASTSGKVVHAGLLHRTYHVHGDACWRERVERCEGVK